VSNAAGAVSSAAETAVQEAPKTITVDLAEENESGPVRDRDADTDPDGTFDVAIELSQRGDRLNPLTSTKAPAPPSAMSQLL
jgi:hypothetical protein